MKIYKLSIAFCLQIFATAVFATDMTDGEANQKVKTACDVALRAINQDIVDKITERGAELVGHVNIGTCEIRDNGVKLIAPQSIVIDEFKDGERPLSLKGFAYANFGNITSEMSATFSWRKFERYNDLGNVIGYKYDFFVEKSYWAEGSTYGFFNADSNLFVTESQIDAYFHF